MWNKFTLTRFGVDFDRTTYTPLTALITDPRYYNPETETTEDFPIRTCVCLLIALMVVYNSIIQGSLEVTEEDLLAVPTNRKIKIKLAQNPLQQLLLTLADMLHVASNRSQELETEKNKQRLTVISPMMPRPFPSESSSSSSQSITQPYSSRFSSSFETPDRKRKISVTSFGTSSTESTPEKLVHLEAKVQSLQNTFVNTIIYKLWLGPIDITWAKGRHMFLTYTELFFHHFCS